MATRGRNSISVRSSPLAPAFLRRLRAKLDETLAEARIAEHAVQQVRKTLQEIPTHVIDWERFEREFRRLHPHFASALLGEYPSLTRAEIAICCMVRLGMSSRDMAALLMQSERTVESHRIRIRRTMGLGRGANLQVLLGTIP